MAVHQMQSSMCLHNSNEAIYALACTKTGEYALCGGKDRVIRLYNPLRSLLIKEYKGGHGYEITDIRFEDASNTMFASCGGDKNVFLWDISTSKIVRKFWGHSQRINCIAFNPQCSVLLSGSFDQNVFFYDLKAFNQSKPFFKLTSHYFKDSITDLLFSHEHEIFTVCMDGYLRTFDIRNGKMIKDHACNKGLTSVSLTGDGKCVLVSCLDDTLRLMNKLNGKVLNEYSHPQFVNNAYKIKSCFGYDDETVVSGSENGCIFVWDLVKGNKEKAQIMDNADKTSIITNVVSHPTKKHVLLSADNKGRLKVWGA